MKRTDKETYLPPFTGVVIMDPQQVVCASFRTSVEAIEEEEEEYKWEI